MPWTTDDVDVHKSGLSPKQKKQWCRIANSVLAACIKKGGTDKTCAPSAIRQANGVVMNTNESKGEYSVYKNKQILNYEVKLTVHQEKAHLVIPVVMMVEGVHNGSQGALFHSMDELGKFPASWNGIPVVIYHPEEDGMSVSANDPDIIDKMTVGRVYNTSVDGKRLKAELWLDEDKLNNISVNTLEDINETKEVEVSLGMFTENILEEGEYNGKKYVGIATNHRPDHLAILPDQIGACSCADGCGLGVNKEETKDILSSLKEDAGIECVDNKLVKTIKKEEQKMADTKCTPCIEKKVKELIENSQGKFTEVDDKDWLQTLSEVQLDKLFVKKTDEEIEEELTAKKKKKEVVKQAEAIPAVNALSDEDKAALAYGKKQLKERKEKMIKGIQDNTEKGIWDDVTLNTMTEELLEKVFTSVKKKEETTGDYSLNGGGVQSNANTEEILLPSGIKFEDKK